MLSYILDEILSVLEQDQGIWFSQCYSSYEKYRNRKKKENSEYIILYKNKISHTLSMSQKYI